MAYDDVKKHDGQAYTGMKVGDEHHWNYPNGVWNEKKISPDVWDFAFKSIKSRAISAPIGSGAKDGTQYHWYIVANQKVMKLDHDSYQTLMFGKKFKIGHKRPYWKGFSYIYPEQPSYKEKVIDALRQTISILEAMTDSDVEKMLLTRGVE